MKLENFNEIIYLLVLYDIFLYSDGTPNLDINYWAGYAQVLKVGLLVTVNLGFMIKK
jgi:hypothetical protein